MSDLLPCPFCGHEPEVRAGRGGTRWYVQCMNDQCKCTVQLFDSRAQAVKAWNTRKDGTQ